MNPPAAPSALPPRGAPPAARRSRLRGGRLAAPWLLAVALGTAAAQDEPKPVVIRAPHYGDTLFGFYQDKYFSTIVNLMVSQHYQRVGPHADEAEVLRGGMMLSYGLHEQAAEIFARLIERNAPLAVRNRAWYFLARMRQQRGLGDSAQAALDRIEGLLPAPLEEERQLLQAQLMMARQDYAAAATVLQAIKPDPKNPTPGLYARFNLGVALIKTGGDENIARGTQLLDTVGQAPGPTEEIKSLRDRANVALGFTALQDKKPREARLALQRVRLNAAQSNKALLGYGWAASELNDPKLALVPWTELAARRADDASVLEAQIAVPYAMAEIGAYSQALEKYQGAVNLFSQEKKALDESIAAIKAGALVRGLLEQNPGEGLGAFARIDQLPEMPHTTHLVPLLADHPFQETFKHLRDLKFLSTNLRGWQDNLATFTDMLDNRRQAFAERLPKVRAAAGAANMGQLEARRAKLADELAQAEAAQDGVVFADAKERELLERVRLARATLAKAQGRPEAAELGDAAERLRRAAGALDWQLTQRLSDRQWAARKGLRDGENALKRAQELDALLLKAQADEPARHERFAARIAELAARIQALQPQVALLDAEVQAQLQDIATAELQGQQERLDTYAAQARLAIAQILDRAQIAQRQERPADGAGTAVPR
jgi:hypothetical protein